MADNNTGLNRQYDGEFFPGIRAAGNKAPGSPGISATETTGDVVGAPVVLSSPYGSSQVPGNLARVPVHSGDTSSMADDLAAHASVIEPGPESAYADTGAGAGNANPYDHPAGNGRWARP